MSESNLYKNLKKNWKGYIKRIDVINGVGFPDVHLVNNQRQDIFLELKYLKTGFKNKKLPIRNSQIKWHYDYVGKNAYILFEINKLYYLMHSSKVINLTTKITLEEFKYNCFFTEIKDIKTITNYFK